MLSICLCNCCNCPPSCRITLSRLGALWIRMNVSKNYICDAARFLCHRRMPGCLLITSSPRQRPPPICRGSTACAMASTSRHAPAVPSSESMPSAKQSIVSYMAILKAELCVETTYASALTAEECRQGVRQLLECRSCKTILSSSETCHKLWIVMRDLSSPT